MKATTVVVMVALAAIACAMTTAQAQPTDGTAASGAAASDESSSEISGPVSSATGTLANLQHALNEAHPSSASEEESSGAAMDDSDILPPTAADHADRGTLDELLTRARMLLTAQVEEAPVAMGEDDKECNDWVDRARSYLEATETRIETNLQETQVLDSQVDMLRREIEEINKQLEGERKDMEAAAADLDRSDREFNATMQPYNEDINAVKAALRDVEEVLDKYHADVADEDNRNVRFRALDTATLNRAMQRSKDKAMNGLIQLIMENRNSKELKGLLVHLQSQLQAHLRVLESVHGQESDDHDKSTSDMRALWKLHKSSETALMRSKKFDQAKLEEHKARLAELKNRKVELLQLRTVVKAKYERLSGLCTDRRVAHQQEGNSRMAQMSAILQIDGLLRGLNEHVREQVDQISVQLPYLPHITDSDTGNPAMPTAATANDTHVGEASEDESSSEMTAGAAAADVQPCAYWKFDERDGEEFAVDSSPFGNDGKLVGMTRRRIQGHHGGGALSFDGLNDYVDLGRVGNFGANLNSFAVSFWIKSLDLHPALSTVMETVSDGLRQAFAINVNRRVGQMVDGVWPKGRQSSRHLAYESGTVLLYLRDQQGRVLAGHVRTPALDGKWHKMKFVVSDASKNMMAAFFDNVPVPFEATIEEGPGHFSKFDYNLFLGAADLRGVAGGFFDGALDDVKLFCHAFGGPKTVKTWVVPAAAETTKSEDQEVVPPHGWTKTSDKPICFGAEKNSDATFEVMSAGMAIQAFRFEHVSGELTCDTNKPEVTGTWGCGLEAGLQLGVFVTNVNGTVVAPVEGDPGITFNDDHQSYRQREATDSDHALELTLAKPLPHPASGGTSAYRIVFADDLFHKSLENNSGTVCVRAYVRMVAVGSS